MAEYNSKVVLGDGTVLIDLTADTVTAETLAEGRTAHNSAGETVSGAATGTAAWYSFGAEGSAPAAAPEAVAALWQGFYLSPLTQVNPVTGEAVTVSFLTLRFSEELKAAANLNADYVGLSGCGVEYDAGYLLTFRGDVLYMGQFEARLAVPGYLGTGSMTATLVKLAFGGEDLSDFIPGLSWTVTTAAMGEPLEAE